ncbi:hypothetical protein YB2330_006023 [Saitoella coloradoensis]
MPSDVPESLASALPSHLTPLTLSSHGGSSFSQVLQLTCSDTSANDTETRFFIKVDRNQSLVRGEHASLNAIWDAVPNFCPQPIAFGAWEQAKTHWFLVTSFIDTKGSPGSAEFARKLAKLHSKTSPDGKFGFEVPTHCGETKQSNTWCDTWAEFYRIHRIQPLLDRLPSSSMPDSLKTALVDKVIPRLLEPLDGKIKPALVHGDLWSGNASANYIFDSSASYSHAEFERGIMSMFPASGWNSQFWVNYKAAREELGSTEEDTRPEEKADRIKLYEMYHQLNHAVMFGGGEYAMSAKRSAEDLVKKYGQ